MAHPEYEKELQKYEKDFRDFMNSENQLKLHIDSLQDKVIQERAEAQKHLDKLKDVLKDVEEFQKESEKTKKMLAETEANYELVKETIAEIKTEKK